MVMVEQRGDDQRQLGVQPVVARPAADAEVQPQQQAERHRPCERGDRDNRQADRLVEVFGAVTRLQPGEMGEDRRLDRLKQLQRRPDDQHHVEHEARQRAPGVAVDDQHRGVHQCLLGEHDPDDGDRQEGAITDDPPVAGKP